MDTCASPPTDAPWICVRAGWFTLRPGCRTPSRQLWPHGSSSRCSTHGCRPEPQSVLLAFERTEREPEAVGRRPLGVYGVCLGPGIRGRCHPLRDLTVRVAERCWLCLPGA